MHDIMGQPSELVLVGIDEYKYGWQMYMGGWGHFDFINKLMVWMNSL